MKKLLNFISLLLCAAATIVPTAYAETATTAAPSKQIRFATEATYPPFEYVDDTGQITGFDIDIAKALCADLKVECTFSTQSFDSLIPSLKLGKYDALIASIGITAQRLNQVDFTQSYYQPSASFVAATNKHYQIKDINGKTIGVQNGTTFATYLQNQYKDAVKMKTYASIQDAFLDLKAGRVDIVLADTPIAQQWLNQGSNSKIFSIIEEPITNEEYFGAGYGIAVRKNNQQLLTELNQALDSIKANGTYAAIEKKYGLGPTH